MKVERLYLKPRAGLTVRDPVTRRLLPPEGARVYPTTFWRRRIASGDVILVKQQETPNAPI